MTERPWPVIVLTALGAWLAAVPFFIVAAIVLQGALDEPMLALTLGVVMLAGSVAVLRVRQASLFVEQLAVPVMLAALALISWGLFEPLDWRGTTAAMCLIFLGLGVVLPQTWIRVCLGAGAAVLALLAWSQEALWRGDLSGLHPWLSVHGLVAVGLGALGWSHQGGVDAVQSDKGALSPELSDLGTGWAVSTLLVLALWSGMTFLLGAQLGHGSLSSGGSPSSWWVSRDGADLGSACLAMCAVIWLAWRRPWLRQPWCLGLGLVLCALSLFMPALGGVLLMAVASLLAQRWRLAILAALVALWVLGAFYYQLAWPLATKAGVLVLAGAALAALAVWGMKGAQVSPDSPVSSTSAVGVPAWMPVAVSGRAWALGACALAVLLVANGAIWQKERLIRHGQAVFVTLAPVDPRSLMQGDYMALRFSTDEVIRRDDLQDHQGAPVRLVFKLDGQRVATPHRLHQGEALAGDELVIEMVRKHGQWLLVTDAFFFKEGEGARWEGARYGEFRVDAGGKALLVGLRGDKLAPL